MEMIENGIVDHYDRLYLLDWYEQGWHEAAIDAPRLAERWIDGDYRRLPYHIEEIVTQGVINGFFEVKTQSQVKFRVLVFLNEEWKKKYLADKEIKTTYSHENIKGKTD